jgi:hypothetical protein
MTAAAINLLDELPKELDLQELRLFLDLRIGGPGQYDGVFTNKLYIPLGLASCRIIVVYKGSRIVALQPGPAFDKDQWSALVAEISASVEGAPSGFGREFSFCSFRVAGSWRGHRSQVQILPPPLDAPSAPVEMAQHPFILEFPLRVSHEWQLTNYRRIRDHRRLSFLLNVLLAGRTSIPPRRPDHFWASISDPSSNPPWRIEWVQEFYFAKLGKAVVESLSEPASASLQELQASEYYERMGHDGQGLRIPSDLDEFICLYQTLAPELTARFDRALFWMDLASKYWSSSSSSSFAALVSAVESLTVRGSTHHVFCPQCEGKRQHESPGAVERFREFFETFAPGTSLRKRRTEMYDLRSGILHGSRLMELDIGRAMGWDPPGWNERGLHDELWSITRIALRNWLEASSMNRG